MDVGELVAQVNEELDAYDETRDVNTLRKRVKRLKEFISEMHRQGFRTPALSLRKLLPGMEELEDEELFEAINALKRYIYSINIKKWTLERATVAYHANKLALYSLEDNILTDYIPFLPYDGSYMKVVKNGAAFMVFTDFMHKKKLPRSTHLIVTYIGLAKSLEEVKLPTLSERAQRYVNIVLSFGIDNIYRNEEIMWMLLQRLEEEGFLTKEGEIDPAVLKEVRSKRFRAYHILSDRVAREISRFLVKYFTYFPPYYPKRPLRGVTSVDQIESYIRDDECKRERILSTLKKIEGLGRSLYTRDLAHSLLKDMCKGGSKAERFLEALKNAKSEKNK